MENNINNCCYTESFNTNESCNNDVIVLTSDKTLKVLDYSDYTKTNSHEQPVWALFTSKADHGNILIVYKNSEVISVSVEGIKTNGTIRLNEVDSDVYKCEYVPEHSEVDFEACTDKDKNIVISSRLLVGDSNAINSTRMFAGTKAGEVVVFDKIEAGYPEFGEYRARVLPSYGYYRIED